MRILPKRSARVAAQDSDRKKRGDKDAQTRVKTLNYNRGRGWRGGPPPRQNKNWIPRIALLEATAVALLVVNGYAAAGGFLRIPGNPAPAEGGAPKVLETAGLAIAWAISDVIAGTFHTSGASQSAPVAGGTNYYRVGGAPSQIGRPWTDTRSGAGGQIYAARSQSFGLPFGGIGIFDRKGRVGDVVLGLILQNQTQRGASASNNSTGARIGTIGTSSGASFTSAGGGSGGRGQSFGAANRSYAGSDVGGHRPEVPPSVATAISGAASSSQSSVVSGQSSTSTASFASASTFPMAAGSGGSGGAGGVDPIWLGTGGTLNWSDDTNWNPSHPDAVGDIADLSQSTLASDQIVTLDIPATIGEMDIGDFGGAFKYTIADAGNALTFDNSGFGATLNVSATSVGDEISAPIVLNDNLNITNNSSNAFTISGTVSSTNTVTLSLLSGDATFSNVISDGTGLLAISQSGSGTLKLSGANIYSGGTTVTGGTLALGSDSVLTLGVITSAPIG